MWKQQGKGINHDYTILILKARRMLVLLVIVGGGEQKKLGHFLWGRKMTDWFWMSYHEHVLGHLNKKVPDQRVTCVTLCSHIVIKGIKNIEYLNEVIEKHKNSKGELIDREGKGIKKNWQKEKVKSN